MSELFNGTTLHKADRSRHDGGVVLENMVVGLYFSARWCPPCRDFTPRLKQFYDQLWNFEIVFVSSDRTEDEFRSYMKESHGNWFAIPFSDEKNRNYISQKFGVNAVPTLIIIDAKGAIITRNGCSDVKQFSPAEALSRWTGGRTVQQQQQQQVKPSTKKTAPPRPPPPQVNRTSSQAPSPSKIHQTRVLPSPPSATSNQQPRPIPAPRTVSIPAPTPTPKPEIPLRPPRPSENNWPTPMQPQQTYEYDQEWGLTAQNRAGALNSAAIRWSCPPTVEANQDGWNQTSASQSFWGPAPPAYSSQDNNWTRESYSNTAYNNNNSSSYGNGGYSYGSSNTQNNNSGGYTNYGYGQTARGGSQDSWGMGSLTLKEPEKESTEWKPKPGAVLTRNTWSQPLPRKEPQRSSPEPTYVDSDEEEEKEEKQPQYRSSYNRDNKTKIKSNRNTKSSWSSMGIGLGPGGLSLNPSFGTGKSNTVADTDIKSNSDSPRQCSSRGGGTAKASANTDRTTKSKSISSGLGIGLGPGGLSFRPRVGFDTSRSVSNTKSDYEYE